MTTLAPRRALPATLARLYPFPSRFTDVDGVAIHHVEAGEGPPVVLLHGNPTWSFLWRAFLPALAAKGYRALAPDHAGFGLSDHPADPAYYSIERHVANFDRWMSAHVRAPASLVVHDWGGPLGLLWAVRNPERVASLAILNTTAFAPRAKRALTPWHSLFGGPASKLLGQDLNLVLETAMRFGVAKRLPREVMRAYRFPFPTSASRVAPRRFVEMVPNGPDHPSAALLREIEAGYAKLAGKPALCVWAEKDPVFSKRTPERFAGALPGLRIVRVPGASHFLQEDAPGPVISALASFLDDHARRR